ncbi:DUF2589 domain-containing protein [Streptomyces sp. WI03-4A]|uniref:DUF2589 domain-containing protein n=1 Tax=Streptomyces sp. WI03-4A TaxID=3028706 RepID=UPI0029A5B28D|nr:DUF2589 domain-containing protein [Streptomyces sp. WI03-4A]MDX2591388.1 DUF2589 domain-containing protein [Streptomyces sp. WI03-4A]
MSDDDVPVGALLGAAYQAVVHGQNLAAREAVELVRDLGFEKDGTAKPFRFAYQRTEATQDGPQVRTVHATVPLLSLINPPAISIDKAAISMSLHLISQGTETGPAHASLAGGEVPAVEGTTPRLKGRIVHRSDSNAVLTIESTLKQRDLLESSRLSQLLDAAVSDHDSVWYEVLDQAEAFRAAAATFIDTVARTGPTGDGEGVREWLQQLWQLKESVTDAVSAYRDGLMEKIPQLHQSWNTQCENLKWIDRHTEPETMAQLRRSFIAAARNVWNALLPGAPVAEFGPPTLDQLRVRFEAAVSALADAPPGLEGMPERLRDLEAAVAQGCIARKYEQPQDVVTRTANRYDETATAIREMWNPSVQSAESREAQDELAAAAEKMWDALGPRMVPVDFRTDSRMSTSEIEECTRLLGELAELGKQLMELYDNPRNPLNEMCTASKWAGKAWNASKEDLQLGKQIPDNTRKKVIESFGHSNSLIEQANWTVDAYSKLQRLQPATWNSAARAWNKAARQFWRHLIDTNGHPLTDLACIESSS